MLATRRLQSKTIRCRALAPFPLSRQKSSATDSADATAADDPIPSQPTWSVYELVSSYLRPSIPSSTFNKLHDLSALIPPKGGTKEHATLKHELEEMVRLVDAVRLVDTSSVASEDGSIPDGRVRDEGEGMKLTSNTRDVEFEDETESGTELLKHASRTKNGYYVVEAERRRK